MPIRAAVDHIQAIMASIPEHERRNLLQFQLHNRLGNGHFSNIHGCFSHCQRHVGNVFYLVVEIVVIGAMAVDGEHSAGCDFSGKWRCRIGMVVLQAALVAAHALFHFAEAVFESSIRVTGLAGRLQHNAGWQVNIAIDFHEVALL